MKAESGRLSGGLLRLLRGSTAVLTLRLPRVSSITPLTRALRLLLTRSGARASLRLLPMGDHALGNIPAQARIGNDHLTGKALSVALLVLAVARGAEAQARPYGPNEFTEDAKLVQLQKRVGAVAIDLLDPCVDARADSCSRSSLGRFRALLDARERVPSGTIRVLHLGDSHIASDFISGYVRHRLQGRFGDGGRGLVHADQRWGFGGRRTKRKDADWKRLRVVDAGGPGKPYGLFGISLNAVRKGAKVEYRLVTSDQEVAFHLAAGPRRPGFQVLLTTGR